MNFEPDGEFPEQVEKRIRIDAPPARVWRALTDPHCVPHWMSDEPFQMSTDWTVGGPIVFRGTLHGRLRFTNSGRVLAFEPERALEYSHWNSLSRRVLPDLPENHAIIRLDLHADPQATEVRLTLSNLGNYAIYGHINYYWELSLVALKRCCESQPR
ncbi:SRPBCC family protein [Pseudomonas sp. CGJS7]|uniref:SRPBCC family protein n=1 Tax=Pseudomonas sp. CGJS7 TaxID=3109348 RepID=UPI0030080ECE